MSDVCDGKQSLSPSIEMTLATFHAPLLLVYMVNNKDLDYYCYYHSLFTMTMDHLGTSHTILWQRKLMRLTILIVWCKGGGIINVWCIYVWLYSLCSTRTVITKSGLLSMSSSIIITSSSSSSSRLTFSVLRLSLVSCSAVVFLYATRPQHLILLLLYSPLSFSSH